MTRQTWLSLVLLLGGCASGATQTAAPEAPPAPDPALKAPAAGGPERNAASAHEDVPPPPTPWRQTSLTGKATASSGFATLACDADGETEWNPREAIAPDKPQWLAMPLAAPAAGQLAVVWHGHGMHYQYGEYGRPRSYAIETSSDSTDGKNGHWKPAAEVIDNPVRSRVSIVEASGAKWVRLRFENYWDGRYSIEPYVREAAVYQAGKAGTPDVWLVMGDSVTSVGFDPAGPQFFSDEVAKRHPGYLPIMISGGTGGDESGHAVDRLRVALPTIPPHSVVGLCYGSNDAARGVPVANYKQRLQAAIDMLRQEGHQPVLAVVPWSLNGAIANYAQACRELIEENQLPPGPDFYTYFKKHPDELRTDKVHPNDAGVQAMQRLWAEAADFRYQP